MIVKELKVQCISRRANERDGRGGSEKTLRVFELRYVRRASEVSETGVTGFEPEPDVLAHYVRCARLAELESRSGSFDGSLRSPSHGRGGIRTRDLGVRNPSPWSTRPHALLILSDGSPIHFATPGWRDPSDRYVRQHEDSCRDEKTLSVVLPVGRYREKQKITDCSSRQFRRQSFRRTRIRALARTRVQARWRDCRCWTTDPA